MSTLTMPGRTDAPADRRETVRHADRLRTMAERALAWIAHELSARRAARDLARLDDRMLRDIGLQRFGIHYEAHWSCDLVSLTPSHPSAARRRGTQGE